jgi:hypothetical protein
VTHLMTPRAVRALAAVLLAVLLGVAAGCSSTGGMYQGGSDSVPGYR